jgi:ribonuclease HI
LNFYGASKGNPGLVGFGGAICNERGEIEWIYAGSLGVESNNAVELFAL